MKNNNIIWGVLLVFVGILFLGENLEWWNLSISSFAKFWPFLLILAGINYILSKKYNASPSGITGILVFFAIILGVANFGNRKSDEIRNEINDSFNIDIDEDDDDDSTVSTSNSNNYSIEMGNTETATLNFTGGAAEFESVEENSKLFLGLTDLKTKNEFKLSSSNDEKETTIDFSMKSIKGNRKYDNGDSSNVEFNVEKGDFQNKVKLGLNKNPTWNFDLKIGAGKGDFDLSQYKVKKFEIQTGAASIDLKLGDKMALTTVSVESGAAAIKIDVPETVGCQVSVDGAFNSKDFDGFDKISSGQYQTPNYEKATKKINITLKSGLSALEINRY